MTTTTQGEISQIKRRLNTRDGNPRWIVSLVDGRVFNTRADSTIGFSLVSTENAKDPATLHILNGEILDITQFTTKETPNV
jgi:hypothetical protein